MATLTRDDMSCLSPILKSEASPVTHWLAQLMQPGNYTVALPPPPESRPRLNVPPHGNVSGCCPADLLVSCCDSDVLSKSASIRKVERPKADSASRSGE